MKKKIKNNITSNKIRELTIKELKKKNKNIAYLYETHLDIS